MKTTLPNWQKQIICILFCMFFLTGCGGVDKKKIDMVINPVEDDLIAISMTFATEVSDSNYRGDNKIRITDKIVLKKFCSKLRTATKKGRYYSTPLIWSCLVELQYKDANYYAIVSQKSKIGTILYIMSNKTWGSSTGIYHVNNALGELIEQIVPIESIILRK